MKNITTQGIKWNGMLHKIKKIKSKKFQTSVFLKSIQKINN